MSSRGPGGLTRIWFKWKSLRLPWRKQFLIGGDLAGNTFWEFKDAINANRWRRIVKYSRKAHFADVKISPQWHQWLRHTRDEAPTIQEQQYEVSRQAMMKQLAAEADERWKSKPSYLDSPARQQPAPAIAIDESVDQTTREQADALGGQDLQSPVGNPQEVEQASAGEPEPKPQAREKRSKKPREENPWDAAKRGAPSENWQPASWTPGIAQRR